MNTYVIAPNLVRVSLDKELSSQGAALNGRLDWRPLTTNLESCEDPPYLYFRITLNLRHGANTYAGFATGAPFMLTRDKDVQKRAFFLRHWVRAITTEEGRDAPFTVLEHMAIGADENRLLVRVEIDRPLDTQDTFKSVPFATWMFQVVQVDAIIDELPGVRFAFAIERTVTAEERDVVANSGGGISDRGPRVKPQPTLAQPVNPTPPSVPTPAAPPAYTLHQHSGLPRPSRPLMRQPLPPSMHAPPMQQTVVVHRAPAGGARPTAQPMHQHNPYQYASSRQMLPAVRQNNIPRAQPIAPSQTLKPAQRVYSRPSPPPPSNPQQSPSESRLLHPYLKLWEDRDPDDPYEPIFVTRDDKFDARTRRSVVIETPAEHATRVEYEELVGLPTDDYPPFYFDGPDIKAGDGAPDLEIVVHRIQRGRVGADAMTDDDEESGADARYAAAVASAAEYSSLLCEERSELKKWLEEDVGQQEEDSEEEEEDDDADQDSSD